MRKGRQQSRKRKRARGLWASGERQRAGHDCLEQTAFWQEENSVWNKKRGE